MKRCSLAAGSLSCLALVVTLLSGACSTGEGNFVELDEKTRLMEQDPAFLAVRVAEDELIFQFQTAAEAIDLKPGDILVGKSDGGYLRKVVSVKNEGTGAWVKTENAKLEEAIKRGRIQLTLQPKSVSTPKGSLSTQQQALDFNLDMTPRFDLSQINQTLVIDTPPIVGPVSGELTQRFAVKEGSYLEVGPELKLDIEIGRKWLVIPTMEKFVVELTGKLNTSLDVTLSTAVALILNKTVQIGKDLTYDMGCVMIGPLPLCVSLIMDLNAGVELSLGPNFKFEGGAQCHGSFMAGAYYDDGNWDTDRRGPTFSCTTHPTKLETQLTASAKIFLKPQAKLALYRMAGPFLHAEAYLRATGTQTMCDLSYEVVAGIQPRVGFGFEFPNPISGESFFPVQVRTDLAGWSKTLTSGKIWKSDKTLCVCGKEEADQQAACDALLEKSCLKNLYTKDCNFKDACGACSAEPEEMGLRMKWNTGLEELLNCDGSTDDTSVCAITLFNQSTQCLQYKVRMGDRTMSIEKGAALYTFNQKDRETEVVCPDGAKETYGAAEFAACRAAGVTNLMPACITSSPDEGDQITERAFGGTEHGSPYNDWENALSTKDPVPRVTRLTLRADDRLDRVQLTYADGTTLSHGGDGGDEQIVDLAPGEYLTQVTLCKGKKGTGLFGLSKHTRIFYARFDTNKREGVAEGGRPSDNPDDRMVFTAPPGYQISGFVGSSGDEVDSLAPIYTPIGG